MKENLFGLPKMNHLSALLVTMLHADVCALTIKNARIIKREVIEHEIQFINNGQLYIINFKANRKCLSVLSVYPIKGIISGINNDGSLVKKMKMGYFNNQELKLSEKGEMNLSFLINDVINTVQLVKINPGIIIGYYCYVRKKLEEIFPYLLKTKIQQSHINKTQYATWLSDTIRKRHFFSYAGTNMFISFQAIIENHPEIFNQLMN
jgi:hypothetical protein